jgi:hypothetical protein
MPIMDSCHPYGMAFVVSAVDFPAEFLQVAGWYSKYF